MKANIDEITALGGSVRHAFTADSFTTALELESQLPDGEDLADLAHETRDPPFSYQGRALTIPQVETDWCSACGESITGPEESRRVLAAMAEARRQAGQAG